MRLRYLFAAVMCAGALAAQAQTTPVDASDPHQDFNHHMFALNDSLDKAVLKPVATLYQTVLPTFAQKGVTHFFDNLDEITTVFNDALQGNGHATGKDSERFLVNTTFGIGGFLDVASSIGIPAHYEDFGLTMAKWGYTQSSYVVLPFLGPSTVRDTLGLPVDYAASVYPYIGTDLAWELYGVQVVNARANLLTYQGVYTQAFDPYVFVRNAYLQRRDAKIVANSSQKG